MITILKDQATTIKIYLNQDKVNVSQDVKLRLNSPSRPSLIFDKSLSQLGLGFYSFSLTEMESSNLVDDTYSYTIGQNGVVLKIGFVHLLVGDEVINDVFDYTLDFTLS